MTNQEPATPPALEEDEVAALDPASWLVLWSVRYWALCYREKRSARPVLTDLYRRNQIADAAYSIDGLMHICALSTTRSLEVRCPCCPKLSGDERLILDAVGYAQRGDLPVARRVLSGWLPESAARMASQMVSGLAGLFAEAGLQLMPKDVQRAAWDHSRSIQPEQAAALRLN